MKLTVAIEDGLEEAIALQAPKMTPTLEKLVTYIRQMDQTQELTVWRGQDIHRLSFDQIYQLVIEDKVLHVKTAEGDFTSQLRLYQVGENLPEQFLQISQSEIINLDYLDYLTLTPNGLVKMTLKNGAITYSSRRYLKSIKEALQL